jgi:hypothetical protein
MIAPKFGLKSSVSSLSRNKGGESLVGRAQLSTIYSVRVLDIILDDTHELFDEYGGWNSIGTIFYEYANAPIALVKQDVLPAFPLSPNIKQYPTINELVPLIFLADQQVIDNPNAVKPYYFPPINIWNSIHHNAIPNLLHIRQANVNADYRESELGIVNRTVEDGGTDITLGETFKEKIDVHPLLPYEGDIIYEGRWGNSIRFSSTVTDAVIPNEWSQNSTENGDPITLIRNGQPTTGIPPEPWIPITENINTDQSSLYLTTTQTIPLEANILDASFSTSDNSPASVNTYNSPQILLNSGRLVLNATSDSVIIGSPKTIHLSALNSVNIDGGNKTTIASPQILLGANNASQQLILGNKFMDDFKLLLELLQDVSDTLSNLVGVPPGAPLNPVLTLQAINLSSKCASLSNNLNSYLSNTTKTV